MLDFLKSLVAPGAPSASVAIGETPPVPGTTRPYVLWADEYDPPVNGLVCPNCGGAAAKPPMLTVRYTTPERPMRFARVLRCTECSCAFYERQTLPEYADDAQLRHGRVPYYLQQGAGISLIASLLARTGRPAGSRYLDVGCGFGFGLDFAARALGWRVQGIDPSPIAAVGAGMLGVAIEARYLGDEEPALKRACDVVMASEVIEHVRSPIGFVRTLRNVLRRGGVLVLTTPDAAELRPETAPGALAGLLAPGFHLIFQSRESLAALLRQAGFGHVEIDTDGYSLVAFASDRPLQLETDQAAVHAAYVGYLPARAGNFPDEHDLRLGFAGRALQEAANDGDATAGEHSFAIVREACRVRFGIDLDGSVEIPGEAATSPLERLAELMPLSLGCLLYADAMRRLAQGEARPALERRFLCAAEASDVLRRALALLTQEDALSEEVAWTARAEAALCAAAAGSPDVVERVRAMPPFPGAGEAHHRLLGERALTALVNAGHHELGAALADAVGLQRAAWADPASDADPAALPEVRRDALFCLAILDLRRSDVADVGRAAQRFALVRRQIIASGGLDAGRGLYWAAMQGQMQALERLGFADLVAARLASAETEAGAPPDDVAATAARIAAAPREPDQLVTLVNAGRYDEARLVAGALGNDAEADPGEALGAAERDRWFSLAMLDLRLGPDAARAARRFAAVRVSLPDPATGPIPELYWAALRGELEAISVADGADAAEALQGEVLRRLGDLGEAIPDDLRIGGMAE